jgi:uncharacterized protein (DUF58 family)
MPPEDFRGYLRAGSELGSRMTLGFRRGKFTGGGGGGYGRRAGSSLEFMDHRDYSPGDDPRTLDWNVYARSEKLTVKVFREEITPCLDLILDGSASMLAGNPRKCGAALAVAAMLASAAANSGCRVKTWLAGDSFAPVVNGSGPPELWDGVSFASGRPPSAVIEPHAGALQRRGVRILISDLLWPGAPEGFVSGLAAGAAETAVVQILSREDASPGLSGRLTLADSETGALMDIDIGPREIERYKEALLRHQQNWEGACRRAGAGLFVITAEDFLGTLNPGPFLDKELLRPL